MAAKVPSKRVTAGTNRDALYDRYDLFVEAFLRNGRNQTQAAITAGYAPDSAKVKGSQLLKVPYVAGRVAERTENIVAEAVLTTDRWAKEMAAIAYFDPAKLYDEQGNLIPIHQLPAEVRAAISSIDVERRMEGKGADAVPVDHTKVRVWDKNTALSNVGKHLGMFERDNRQKTGDIKVLVQLVG